VFFGPLTQTPLSPPHQAVHPSPRTHSQHLTVASTRLYPPSLTQTTPAHHSPFGEVIHRTLQFFKTSTNHSDTSPMRRPAHSTLSVFGSPTATSATACYTAIISFSTPLSLQLDIFTRQPPRPHTTRPHPRPCTLSYHAPTRSSNWLRLF